MASRVPESRVVAEAVPPRKDDGNTIPTESREAIERLRVRDLDFERQQIVIREGKGMKDRGTVFPRCLQGPLQEHLALVRAMHDLDVSRGYGAVALSPGFARRQPNARCEWLWQFVFPAGSRRR